MEETYKVSNIVEYSKAEEAEAKLEELGDLLFDMSLYELQEKLEGLQNELYLERQEFDSKRLK